MTLISRANGSDTELLLEIARLSFLESHADSAGADDIRSYLDKNFNYAAIENELTDPENIYHIIYYDMRAVGYSKIILNNPYEKSNIQHIAKLERLYLLKEFYALKLGLALFQFNVDLARTAEQAGLWLFVWKDNERAVRFYKKNGFVIIGSYDFKITATHSNPNYQMFLKF